MINLGPGGFFPVRRQRWNSLMTSVMRSHQSVIRLHRRLLTYERPDCREETDNLIESSTHMEPT